MASWVCFRCLVLLLFQAAVAVADWDITVTSTSRSQGNQVDFEVNAKTFEIARTGRGVNLATVNIADGSLSSFHLFDTHADGSEALVSFIDTLPAGTLVLMAVRDDAQSNMTRLVGHNLSTVV